MASRYRTLAKVSLPRPKATVPGRYGTSVGRAQNVKPKPAPRPPAPAGPGAPPPPPPGPPAQALPFDATYEQDVANANRQFDVTNAGIQYQEGALKQEYGFDDVSNPFNRAAMLQQAYTRGVAARRNVAGNRMYSSAFNSGETEGRSQYDQNYGNLRSTYDAKLNDFSQQRYQAGVDRDAAATGAYGERIARAPAAEDPGPPPPPPGAPGAAKAAAGKKAPGRVLRPGERPPPIHRGNQGTLTVNKPKRPGVYARATPVKPKPRKKSKYGGRVL
jgi:hypothetical protein